MSDRVVHIDVDLHREFKAWCKENKVQMKVALADMVQAKVRQRQRPIRVLDAEERAAQPWERTPFWDR